MSREAIYTALERLLINRTGARTVSRRMMPWAQINTIEQPAIFVCEDGETVEQETGMPAVWTYHVELMVYVNAGGDAIPPVTLLNPLLDQIEALVGRQSNPIERVQTLGGLVRRTWISGRIEKDRGELGNQAVAVVPVSIQLIPSSD